MSKNLYCRFMYFVGRTLFPKRNVVYSTAIDNDEASIYISNHSGVIGPCTITAWFDRPFKAWSISCIYDKKIAPNYMYHDFFFARSKKHKKIYRGLSKIVAKMLPPVLLNEKPILVYRNSPKIVETFKESVSTLKEGKNLVIFPECPKKYSEFINELYDGFVEIARYYYKETGKKLKFYPVYIPSNIKIISVGEPIEYDPSENPREERVKIANYLKESIDKIGRSLPTHKCVPFLREEFYKYYSEYIDNPEGYWKLCNVERSE